ncbi:MAG TPA: hypothetical protein ENK86_00630 [Campylobacterales bacterium]|nr:hypothetical protein [Campylobacterales bacterium]
MIRSFRSVSPLFKLSFIVSLLLLLLWVIPSMVSYYKNQKLYGQKVETLAALDKRVGAQLDAKPFHSEVFKVDAEASFDKVDVTAIENNMYRIMLEVDGAKISSFYTYLQNLSLNYAVSVVEPLIFEDKKGKIRITMVVQPY